MDLKEAGVQLMSSSLVGKILTNKQVNGEVFKSVITKIWRLRKELDIEVISRNTFAFHFSCSEDKVRVLKGGPWSFDDALMVLVEPGGKGDIKSMLFNKTDFWVQILNVPLICMTVETGKFLGSIIGTVKEIDGGDSGVCMGKFLRVRVEVEIDKPLRRCLRIDVLGDGEETVMPIQYERLPDFCFGCGMVGHVLIECSERLERVGVGSCNKLLFGAWMRASAPTRKATAWGRHMGQTKDDNS